MARAQRKGNVGAKQYADDHIQNLVGVGHTLRICVSNFSIYNKKRPCFQRFVKTGAYFTVKRFAARDSDTSHTLFQVNP